MIAFGKCCGCIPLNSACICISGVELLIKLSSLVLFGPGIFSSIGIFTEFMLVYGVAKERHAYMWPWIVFNVFAIVALAVAIVCCILALTVDPSFALLPDFVIAEPTKEFIVNIIIILTLIAASFTYFTLVVCIYTFEMREIEKRLNDDDDAHPEVLHVGTEST